MCEGDPRIFEDKTLTHVLPSLPRFAGRDAVLLEALAPALVRRRGVVAVGAGVPLAVVGRGRGPRRGRRGPRVGVARHAVAAAVTWHESICGGCQHLSPRDDDVDDVGSEGRAQSYFGPG